MWEVRIVALIYIQARKGYSFKFPTSCTLFRIAELKASTLLLGVWLNLLDKLWEENPWEEYCSETSRYSQFLIPNKTAHLTFQLRKYWPFPEADMSVWEIYTKCQMFLELNGFENFKVPLDPDRKLCIFCGFSPICNSQEYFTLYFTEYFTDYRK